MVTVTSQRQALASLERANDVLLTAYLLRPGKMLDALERAARRGAKVTVRLEARPYADADHSMRLQTARVVRELRAAGADARLYHCTNAQPPLHMKALVCDGTAFLDDRNWPGDGRDTIVRDDYARDVRAIRESVRSARGAAGQFFATSKSGALRQESRLLYGSAGARTVDVETESFDASPQVYSNLKHLASEGVHCRLLVAAHAARARAAHAMAQLQKAGVDVRLSDNDEKVAIVDAARAWVGSANATSTFKYGNQLDWGLRSDSPQLVNALQRHFDANWKKSAAFAEVTSATRSSGSLSSSASR
ncbi:MAG TPA: phospholipase D-like domain-containing protein [Candidatus Baltobacteraceae bacterium]|nr:phospholipase D-like domain-containing protein [Candidatus Baltobacteraceae bacterium]